MECCRDVVNLLARRNDGPTSNGNARLAKGRSMGIALTFYNMKIGVPRGGPRAVAGRRVGALPLQRILWRDIEDSCTV
jgi:hypothetical protein